MDLLTIFSVVLAICYFMTFVLIFFYIKKLDKNKRLIIVLLVITSFIALNYLPDFKYILLFNTVVGLVMNCAIIYLVKYWLKQR